MNFLIFQFEIKAEEIYWIMDRLMDENYPNIFSFIKSSSLDFQSGMSQWGIPTIIFYEKCNSLIFALLEMKSFKLNFKKNIMRIFLNENNVAEAEKLFETACKEQKWIVVDGLECLSERNVEICIDIMKKISRIRHDVCNRNKIWIFYRKMNVNLFIILC
jgi:hypothetical protein